MIAQNIAKSEFKRPVRMSKICPICKHVVTFGVEEGFLKGVTEYPFPHVVLHGNPVHALIAYIDAHHKIRGVEACASIEVSRDQETFSQLLKKWSNPF